MGGHTESIGTTSHETRLTKVQETGVAELHIQPQSGDSKIHRVDPYEALEAVFKYEIPIHG